MKTNPFVLVLLGKSRSGKDTFYANLTNDIPTLQVKKFVSKCKRAIEEAYGLVEGALELPEFRSMQVPGKVEGFTFLDLMIDAYHNLDWMCNNVWIPSICREALQDLELGLPVVFTDTRKRIEANKIAILSYQANVPLYVVHIDRDVPALSSDANLGAILHALQLHASKFYRVDNNLSLAHLISEAHRIAKDIA